MNYELWGTLPRKVDKHLQFLYNRLDIAKRRREAVSTLLPKGGGRYADYFNFSCR